MRVSFTVLNLACFVFLFYRRESGRTGHDEPRRGSQGGSLANAWASNERHQNYSASKLIMQLLLLSY